MLNRFYTALMILAMAVPLYAQQDGPIKMTPEFPLTFPLTNHDKDVTVKYPILVNPTDVIKPGMVLRTIYVLSYNVQGSSDLIAAHHGNMEEAYARSTAAPGGAKDIPPELAHEIEGYRRTIWEVSNNFVLAMAQYPTDTMHMIYSPTGKNQDLNDVRFSFFDGLMVGLPEGKVTVLAVENDSKTDRAGIKAGDEILAVGGVSTKNDLTTFAAAYARAKKIAKENGESSYPMLIVPAGKSESHVVPVPMPATFKNTMFDGI